VVENFKKLEIVKLIKELDFVESEFQYRSEIIKEIDIEFRKQVENFLDANFELKDVFKKSVNLFTEAQIPVEPNVYVSEDQEIVTIEKNPKLKSLYRTIAKATHPDKLKDESLKEIYLQATKAYEDNDLLPIISICDRLKIPFEVNDEEFESIKNKIETLRKRTNFLETTYPWQWYNQDNEQEKSQIVIRFIKSQIF
jgi:hypothetical protein